MTDKITPFSYPGCLMLLLNSCSWHVYFSKQTALVYVSGSLQAGTLTGIWSIFCFKLIRTSSWLSGELLANQVHRKNLTLMVIVVPFYRKIITEGRWVIRSLQTFFPLTHCWIHVKWIPVKVENMLRTLEEVEFSGGWTGGAGGEGRKKTLLDHLILWSAEKRNVYFLLWTEL